MLRLLKNRRLWIALGVIGALLAVAFWPSTVAVDVASVTRGPLVVTIDEEGSTRVRERFVVSAPVSDAYGIGDAVLSLPCVIGRRGVDRQLVLRLSGDEQRLLERSAAVVDEAYRQR